MTDTLTSTLMLGGPRDAVIRDADLDGLPVVIPAGTYELVAPIVDLRGDGAGEITGLLIRADDGAFWAGLAEVTPDMGIISLPAVLTCGHTVHVHATSSTWDFPQDGSWCPTCGDTVALDPAHLPGF